MYFVELAAQGVLGFRDLTRAPLPSGYGVVRASSDEPELASLVTCTCYPGRAAKEVTLKAEAELPGRFGLTLLGDDRNVYRVVRELGVASSLHRWSVSSGKFEVLTLSPEEVEATLRTQVGLPSLVDFEQLFCFRASMLPSRKGRPVDASSRHFERVPGVGLEDPLPALMRQAEALFALDLRTLVAEVDERCGQYLSALSDRRFRRLEIDLDGRSEAVGAVGGVPASQLSAWDLDIAYLSMRLALLEKYTLRSRVPVVLDGALLGSDEPKRPLFERMLRYLGSMTQVVQVLTVRPASPLETLS